MIGGVHSAMKTGDCWMVNFGVLFFKAELLESVEFRSCGGVELQRGGVGAGDAERFMLEEGSTSNQIVGVSCVIVLCTRIRYRTYKTRS